MEPRGISSDAWENRNGSAKSTLVHGLWMAMAVVLVNEGRRDAAAPTNLHQNSLVVSVARSQPPVYG